MIPSHMTAAGQWLASIRVSSNPATNTGLSIGRATTRSRFTPMSSTIKSAVPFEVKIVPAEKDLYNPVVWSDKACSHFQRIYARESSKEVCVSPSTINSIGLLTHGRWRKR